MTTSTSVNLTSLSNQIAVLPKVDLHRHLEGSIRLQTMFEITREYQLDLPAYDLESLRTQVQITSQSPMTSAHFLEKFTTIRRFFCSQEVIQRIAREAVEDAAADNVKYMEMRCTPKALAKLMDFSFASVVQWVCEAVDEAAQRTGIVVRLIISMNRHESVKEGERALQVAFDFRDKGVVGIDLAGQEWNHVASPFYDLFAQAKQAGLGITVHAGEWAGPANIRDAITRMGAQRIGHGVRVIEDSVIVQLARENGITFEVCPTSNIQTGAASASIQHPLADMTHIGLKTTINTDDPSICNITLSNELCLAIEKLGLSFDEVKECLLNSAKSAFLPDVERTALVDKFRTELDAISPLN